MGETKMKPKKSSKQTVAGILVAEKWDNKGNVVSVSIQAFDESKYIVKTYKLGKELLNFINESVKVTGKVFERLDGRLIIEVNGFDVIKGYEEV